MGTPRLLTADGIDFNEVFRNVVIPVVDVYNRDERLELRAMLTEPWDEREYKTYAPSTDEFTPLAPNEMPNFIKVAQGFHRFKAVRMGLGIGWDEQFLRDASMRDITVRQMNILEADRRLQTKRIVGAMLINDSTRKSGWWNTAFSSDEAVSAPPNYATNTFAASHTHYYRTGTATFTPAAAHTACQHIREHGYLGPFIGFLHSTDWKNLCDLYTFDSSSVKVYNSLTESLVTRGITTIVDNLFGISRIFITDWFQQSWGAVMDIGDPTGRAALYVEPNNAAFKGLRVVSGNMNVDYPIFGSYYIREFDVHTIRRGAGVAFKIAADSAAYPNPSMDYFQGV